MTGHPDFSRDITAVYAPEFAVHAESLLQQGYTLKAFENRAVIDDMRRLLADRLRNVHGVRSLDHYHEDVTEKEAHVAIVLDLTETLDASGLQRSLIAGERAFIQALLGPELNVQRRAHLRVTRPGLEHDQIGLHRDTFYGPSPEFLNMWFPLTPLDRDTGLYLQPESHLQPSVNVREKGYDDAFRRAVKRGTKAHQIGFLYVGKTDDSVDAATTETLALIQPDLYHYALFFGCMIHGGASKGTRSRFSMDLRLWPTWASSTVRDDYFEPYARGVVGLVSKTFRGQ